MPTLTISDQLDGLDASMTGRGSVSEGGDGTLRALLYDSDNALVAGTTVVFSPLSGVTGGVAYTWEMSGIPESYSPGYIIIDTTDGSMIRSATVPRSTMIALLKDARESAGVGWGDEEDLVNLLTSAGVTVPEDTRMTDTLLAAIREAERRVGRSYSEVTEARRIDGNTSEWLFLSPCSAITLLERLNYDGTVAETIAASAYLSYPLNLTTKCRLRKILGTWRRGKGNYRVTATWGAAVPRDVREAALKLAAIELITPNIVKSKASGGVVSWTMQGDSVKVDLSVWEGVTASWSDYVDRVLAGNVDISCWFAGEGN